jgi:ATP-binding cassette subfamily B protein
VASHNQAESEDGTAPPDLDLPDQITGWLNAVLNPGESVHACLFSDILPDGRFGEQWTFLSNSRLFVLGSNGAPDKPEMALELPIDRLDSARVQSYVGSGALIVTGEDDGHEVTRFSLASQHEALDLCYYINAVIEGRGLGKSFEEVSKPSTMRVEHRCSTCGRTINRNSQVCSYCLDKRRVLMRLFSYVAPYKITALLGLALTLLLTGTQLAPPYLTKLLIDEVIIPGNVPLLPLIICALIAAYVGGAILSVIRSYILQWVGQKVLFDLRVELYNRLQILRLSYFAQRQTGRIMSRVTGDLSRLQYFVAEGYQELLISIVSMVLVALILMFMNSTLFLLALAPIPLIWLSTWFMGKRIRVLYYRIWRRVAGLNALLADTIPGIRVVKAFARESHESKRFRQQSADVFEAEMQTTKITTTFFPLITLQTAFGSILVFAVGGIMVINGSETLGTLVAFTSYLLSFYQPVQQLGRMNQRLQHCATSAERVFEILDSDPEPLNHTGVKLEPFEGRVEFRNVRFSYEPGKYALDGVSFTVEPGEMIGLVGPSGAGKSTLVHLITRFYDAEEGEVLIDGHPIQEIDLHWFRRQIGVVLQEPYLFHGTLWSNIAYANPEASADEIIAAAKAANAHDFIVDLPEGYDSVVGERGQTLSGGERQRISIARAVLRDPKILILDEATASVDTETEAMIQTAVERLVKDRTTFAIAHRLSTLRNADRLIGLENSKLVEMGSHSELLAAGGLFARLSSLQAEMAKSTAV